MAYHFEKPHLLQHGVVNCIGTNRILDSCHIGVDDTRMIYLDFETYFDPANGYGLKSMSMLEYIKDPKFKIHGVGLKLDNYDTKWLSQSELETSNVDWDNEIVVAHNAKFDGAILEWVCDIKPKGYVDTLSMARAILGTRVKSHSLAAVAEFYAMAPKGEMKTAGLLNLTAEQEKELADYCLHDVELCRLIYKQLAKGFPKGEYEVMDWAMKCFIRPSLRLDEVKLNEINKKEAERRANIFTRIGIDKSVFSSNKSFPALLTERGYEVPTKKSPKTNKDIPALALGDEGFRELVNSGNQELEELCEARIAAKSTLLETRSAKFMKLCNLGPFPFDISYSGAKQTHRFSGADGAGGNPQNLRPELKTAITAPEGSVLVVGDFAAIEARIVAWLAHEEKLMALFTSGEDPYCAFASKFYKHTITKANVKERKFGKEAILGLGYGMGADKFADRVKLKVGTALTHNEAWEAVQTYRTTYYKIPALWQTLNSYLGILARRGSLRPAAFPFLELKDGDIILPSGLKLQYPGLSKNAEDEWEYEKWDKGHLVKRKIYGGMLLENISQALAGEICKTAISNLGRKGLHIIGQVHDEILATAHSARATMAVEVLISSMQTSPIWWPSIKLAAEVGYGRTWKEAKP